MQKPIWSLVEQVCNVVTGYLLSLVIWVYVIIPVFEIDNVNMEENMVITGIFTIMSIVKGYVWRRIFNRFTG